MLLSARLSRTAIRLKAQEARLDALKQSTSRRATTPFGGSHRSLQADGQLKPEGGIAGGDVEEGRSARRSRLTGCAAASRTRDGAICRAVP